MYMNKLAIAVVVLAVTVVTFCAAPADAKRWTVTQRIEKLSAEIDEGRKANELTAKQVDSLKKEIATLKERIEKMQSKNDGKLSLPDQRKLHDDMTELSVKILRMRLNNVYAD